MRFGVHLPQFGRAAGPEAIARTARQAEELGFDDVWVSDHLVVPDGLTYPPAFLYEPVITLTWAAAATSQVGLGTSVLIIPYRHPVHLAKELASLDQLSGGRLTVGAGAGWLEPEFEALGLDMAHRGARTDEYLDALRACWGAEDPFSFHGPTVSFDAMKVRPKPAHPIALWVGGASPKAIARAVAKGDGWHGNLPPEEAKPLVEELRAGRPEPEFTLSMRTDFDGLRTSESEIVATTEVLVGLGFDHLITMPVHSDLSDWLRSVEELWRILSPYAEVSAAS